MYNEIFHKQWVSLLVVRIERQIDTSIENELRCHTTKILLKVEERTVGESIDLHHERVFKEIDKAHEFDALDMTELPAWHYTIEHLL